MEQVRQNNAADINFLFAFFWHYSQNTRTFPLPVLKLVLYFSNIASVSETSSVILQLLQKPYDHNMNIVHIYDTVV